MKRLESPIHGALLAVARSGGNRPYGLVAGMAPLIYLDTHVAAWLYAGQVERIPAMARKSINEVARRALTMDWTRDPFDRLIVSQASLREAPLVTKDSDISKNYSGAFWAIEQPR